MRNHMTSFTIASNKDNAKSILSSTLLDILNETRIALNELDRDFNKTSASQSSTQIIENIYSLGDENIDTDKLCRFIYTELFKNLDFYIRMSNEVVQVNSYADFFEMQDFNIYCVLFNETKHLRGFLLSFLYCISITSNSSLVAKVADEIKTPYDFIVFAGTLRAMPRLNSTLQLHRTILRCYIKPLINQPENLLHFIYIYMGTSLHINLIEDYEQVQRHYNTIFHNNNNAKKELTIGSLTLCALEKYIQENKLNLLRALKICFPTIAINAKQTHKSNETNHIKDSKKSIEQSYKEHLLNNTFHIDDEYKEEIMQKIDEAFVNSNDIEKILTQDFNQFEDILIKNNDYSTYTDKQKEIVENLKNMYIVLNNAIDSLYTTLSDDRANESPRAKRRNYLRAIQEYNKTIDSLYLKTQTDKPMGNPFLDPTLNPRINE